MKNFYLQIHPKDNVLVALQDLEEGKKIFFNDSEIILKEKIPSKHKLYINNMKVGDEVFMYGVLVGKMQTDIASGQLMTTSNLQHAAEPYFYKETNYKWQTPNIEKFKNRTFNGYYRSNGTVGSANYWLFIPTVFCENRNLDVIRESLITNLGYATTDKYKQFTAAIVEAYKNGENTKDGNFSVSLNNKAKLNERLFKNVDGIKFLNHNGGCGGTRQDSSTLCKLLAAYANHPNVGGVTILSLGCQHLQLNDLITEIKQRDPNFDKPLFVFEQQQAQSEEQLISKAILETFNGLTEINKQERKPAPLSSLSVGVKCGGSDGFSGISANPAVGHAADMLVALGGKVLLAEFPELCGVEQNLIDRCQTEETATKFIKLMRSYDELAHKLGSGFHMNPSPGNIKDGLITDAIKSAGAAKKGGSAPVSDVLDYTECATKSGLNLVCTPGNDVEATTGKTAAGANLILFTTGLGTPTGNPICPVVKLASNSTLAQKMSDIIDINCGEIITGEKTIEEMGEDILEYCIKAAGGEIIPKAVQLNQDDFIPWKRGVSL